MPTIVVFDILPCDPIHQTDPADKSDGIRLEKRTLPMFKVSQFERNNPAVSTVSKNGGVVLDVQGKTDLGKTGRLLRFNSTGLEMWQLLCEGRSEAQVAAEIARKYRVDERIVAGDLANLICDANGLGLTPNEALLRQISHSEKQEDLPSFPWYAQDGNVQRPEPGTLTTVCAFLGLLLFDLILSWLSMEAMCKTVKRWPLSQHTTTNGRGVLIGQICTAVDKSCVWYPKKQMCLQRSAVTACMLRTLGIGAEMVIAVRVMPVMPHAWVEFNGAVVNDRPQVKKFYQRLTGY